MKEKNNNKLCIKLKSFDHKLIILSSNDIINAVKKTGSLVIGPIPLPNKIEKFIVLTSPHVDKDAREQFALCTHKRLLYIINYNNKTIDSLIHLNINPGVYIKMNFIFNN